jgi:phosphatidylglycerol:prolipoprotein diacylglycerol transferase
MISPILAELGPFTIRWYGVTAALGMAASFWYIKRFARAHGICADLTDAALAALLAGIIGARLYHVFNEWEFYRTRLQLIPALWHGGLAIHGAFIAGALVIFYYARLRRVSFLKLADIFMPALLLGQAVGRWGNFFNQELFGKPTALPWGIFIDEAYRPKAFAVFTHFHPTFLYESLWNALAVAILTVWVIKKPPVNGGAVFSAGLILWGMGRLITEFLRVDPVPVVFGARLPLLMSIAMLCLGGMLLIFFKQRYKKEKGRA